MKYLLITITALTIFGCITGPVFTETSTPIVKIGVSDALDTIPWVLDRTVHDTTVCAVPTYRLPPYLSYEGKTYDSVSVYVMVAKDSVVRSIPKIYNSVTGVTLACNPAYIDYVVFYQRRN